MEALAAPDRDVKCMKRKISWLLCLLAIVAPPIWAYFEKKSLYEEVQAQYGYICGLPILAIIGLACFSAALLSFLSLMFGILSFRSLTKPRPWYRVVELVVLGLPAILSILYVGILFNV